MERKRGENKSFCMSCDVWTALYVHARRGKTLKQHQNRKKVTSENVFSQVISHSVFVAVYVSVHFVFRKCAFLLQWKSFAGPNRHLARSLRRTVTRPKITCPLWWTPTADWWGKHDISQDFTAVWARVLVDWCPLNGLKHFIPWIQECRSHSKKGFWRIHAEKYHFLICIKGP